ncbi:MAG: PorV/PorQ family protein [Nitrospirota bacterium]
MQKLQLILAGVACIVIANGTSLAAEDGGVQSPFILGADARALSMGKAYVSIAQGPSALYWNPAGLTQTNQKGFSLLHSNLFWDTSYDFIGYCYPTPRSGVFGLGVFRLNVTDIEERDPRNNLINPSLENEQLEYIFSYSRELVPSFSYGLSLNLNTHKIYSYSATGVGVDVGMLYRPNGRFNGLAIGANLQNLLEPTLKLKDDTTKYPMNLKAGISYYRQLTDKLDDEFIISIDVDKSRLTKLKRHAGIEYSLYKTLSLRAGLDQEDWTYGFGLGYKGFRFDYAYAGQELEDTHKFAVNLSLGQTVEEMRQRLRKKEEEDLSKKLEKELAKREQLQAQLAFNRGKEFFEAKQYKEAIIQFERVLTWVPQHSQTNSFLALARDEYQKEKVKAEITLHLEKGQNYLNNKEYLDAALEFRQVLILEPANSQALASLSTATENIRLDIRRFDRLNQYFNRGIEAYTNSRLVEAITAWRQVLEIDPNHKETLDYMKKAMAKLNEEINRHILAGNAYQTKKMWDKAIEEFEKALLLDPENKEAKELIKEAKSQVEHVQRMVKTQESRALAYLDEGIELFTAGEYGQASTKFQKALILNKNLNEAQIYLDKSNAKSSELKKKELSPQLTKQVVVAYDKGLRYFQGQKITQAIKQLEFVYEHNHQYREIQLYLIKGYLVAGMEHYTTGRLSEAINTWEKVLQIDPENQKAISYINRTKTELAKIEEITGK